MSTNFMYWLQSQSSNNSSFNNLSFSQRVAVAVLIVLLSGMAYGQPQPSQTSGTMAAAFEVSALGEAVYSVNFNLPPGTADMSPELGIVYSSQGADGLLGLGFSLSGISAISRCEATQTLDGFISAVDYTDSDRFCLDGQRLILISNGRYGGDNTVYHTENETWTRVVAKGVCGSGPCSFTAYNKDGWQLEYGSVANARLQVPGRPEMIAWQMYRTIDLNSNYVEVVYQSHPNILQNLPIQIRYTGNLITQLQPQRSVLIDYLNKPENIPKYMGGSRFIGEQRISRIRTEVSAKAVLEYRFNYSVSDNSGRSLLTSVQTCSPVSGDCLAATRFAWQTTVNAVNSPNSRGDGQVIDRWCSGSQARTSSGDFNGDGLIDLLCTSGSSAQSLLSDGHTVRSANNNANGQLNLPNQWCIGNDASLSWSDFNGDQKVDLLCAESASSLKALVSNGSNVVSANRRADGALSIPPAWCPINQQCSASWVNFDGDGRADVACNCENGEQRVLISDGQDVRTPNNSPVGTVATGFCKTSGAQPFWSDFNGDGLTDLFCREGGRQSVLVSDGKRLSSPNNSADGVLITNWCGTSGATLDSADFNGDQLYDLSCHGSNGLQQVLLSTGTGLASPNNDATGTVRTNWCNSSDRRVDWGDFNSDGLADMFCHETSGAQSVLVSTGIGVQSPVSNANGLIISNWCGGAQSIVSTTDFNGDALGDLSCHDSSQGRSLIMVHQQPYPDLITKITNGLGGDTIIDYAPMTNASVYSTGGAISYPILDVQSPKYLVSHYTTTDGQGAQYRYAYHYTGARTDLLRRSWLGFASIKRTRVADGRYSITRYAQNFPVVRFMSSVELFNANGIRLNSAQFTPFVNNPYPNVYQVLRGKEVSSTYTNNQADYVYEIDYEYDGYGNPRLISNLGNLAKPDDDVFDCWKYHNDTTAWALGYPVEHKTTSTAVACRNFLAANQPGWQAATDLRWDKTGYDAKLNTTLMSAWDDANNIWLEQAKIYNDYGLAVQSIDWANQITRLSYDSHYHSFISQTQAPALASNVQLTVSNVFDPRFGVLEQHTDPNGNIRASKFDDFGRLVEQWGPDPNAASGAASVRLLLNIYASDGFGHYVETRERLTWQDSDPANWSWIRVYVDGMGRPIKTTKSAPAGGQAVATEQRYNNVELPSQSSLPYFLNAQPSWVNTFYDAQDRQLRIEQPDGSIQTFDYLQGMLKVRAILAAGTPDERQSINESTVREVLAKAIGNNQGEIQYSYDPLLQTTSVIGANQDVTRIGYDSVSRILSSNSADSGAHQMVYNHQGRLGTVTDADGNITRYTYDAINRVTTRTVTAPSGGSKNYQYFYDEPQYTNAKGNLTRVIGPDSTHEFSYNRYGLVATERVTLAGRSFVQHMQYDPSGDIISLTYPDGAVLTTQYDAQGNVTSQSLAPDATSPASTVATYSAYNALNQLVKVEYGNGVSTQQEYYPYAQSMSRMKSMTAVSNQPGGQPQTLYAVDYDWNRVGQVTGRNVSGNGASPGQYQYNYNNMGWLIKANGPNGILDYDYDLAGNITSKDGVTYQYQPNTNKILSGSNQFSAQHDNNGNITQMQWPGIDWSYIYDQEARLVEVQKNGTAVNRMSYDFNGQRLQRTDENGNQSLYVSADYDVLITANRELHTKYIDGPGGRVAAQTTDHTQHARQVQLKTGSLQLGMLLFEQDNARGWWSRQWHAVKAVLLSLLIYPLLTLTALLLLLGVGTAWYLWLSNRRLRRCGLADTGYTDLSTGSTLLAWGLSVLLVISHMPVAQAQLQPGTGYPEPGLLYFQGDVVDSNVLVTNDAGQLSSVVAYLPYGGIDEQRSSGPDNFRPKFGDKEYDYGSELYYFGARYLHSELGRFVQPDPEQQFSTPYSYVGNDPLSMIDPSGEIATAVVIGIMAIIGAIVGAYAGGAAVNHDMNPAHWDWRSGKTLAGIFAGAAIGAAGGAIGGAAAQAGVAVGIVGEILVGVGEGAAFAALGGGSPKEILVSALVGGVTGGLFSAGGAGLSRIAGQGSRLARRGASGLLDEAGAVGKLSRRGSISGELASSGDNRALQSSRSAAANRRSLSPSELEDIEGVGNLVCFSFTADTQVLTDQGLTPISEIKPGDQVWAMSDPEHSDVFTVLSNYQRLADDILVLRLDDSQIETTAEHPFWVPERGWVQAGELTTTDQLLSKDGDQIAITGIEQRSAPQLVYNFEVAEAHNYFVDEKQVLAHNPKYCKKPKSRRLLTMGRTPGKGTKTGRIVKARMKSKGWIKKIGGVEYVKVSVTQGGARVWKPINRQIHMGHIVDAVDYWNKIGYKTGAKSKTVRKFMLDASNYELEWGPLNSSNGAKLGQTYNKPNGWKGKWPP